jgi:signal transduction histidine kinase
LRVRDEVLAAISHDLRTPLTTIKGMSSLLIKRLTSDKEPSRDVVIDRLGLVGRAADQMEGMIQDFLDFSRLEAGRPIDLDLQEVDLVGLIRRLAGEYQGQTSNHALRVETDLTGLDGFWDSTRLERVLLNLLSNAVKYSPDGGPIAVGIARQIDEHGRAWARVDVRDQGVGIPASELPRVFERFYRGSNVTGIIRGIGIGLTGAKGIVEQHGGRMQLESEEGMGTCAVIWLPIDRPEPESRAGS